MIRIALILFLGLSMMTKLFGQDVTLHNLNQHITNYNPAMLGLSTHDYSVGINYRQALNLLSSGRSGTASVVSPNRISSFYLQYAREINQNDKVSIEARVLDENPISSLIARTDLALSFSYSKLIGNSSRNAQILSIGTSFGYDIVRLTNADFWFGSQYDIINERVDLGIPSGEIALNQLRDRAGFDLSVGVSWESEISGFGSYYFGLSAFHLNPYNQAVYQGSVLPIQRRYTAIAGLRKKINTKISWINTIVYTNQDVFQSWSYRTSVFYQLDPYGDNSVLIGLMPVAQDGLDGISGTSVNLFAGYQSSQYSFNLSYDIGLGSITQFTDRRGTLEFGFNYLINRVEGNLPLSDLY